MQIRARNRSGMESNERNQLTYILIIVANVLRMIYAILSLQSHFMEFFGW